MLLLFIVEGLSHLQQSPLSFAVIIDCSGLRSSRYEINNKANQPDFQCLTD